MYRDKDIAHIKSYEEYEKIYKESIDNPDSFWEKQANRLNWYEKWNTIKSSIHKIENSFTKNIDDYIKI